LQKFNYDIFYKISIEKILQLKISSMTVEYQFLQLKIQLQINYSFHTSIKIFFSLYLSFLSQNFSKNSYYYKFNTWL